MGNPLSAARSPKQPRVLNVTEFLNRPSALSLSEMEALCRASILYLQTAPIVPSVCGPCSILSDINGKTLRSFYINSINNKESLVFLGNYTAEKGESVRGLCQILAVGLLLKNQCIILRGPRETESLAYGLQDELVKMFGEGPGTNVFKMFLAVFNCLPMTAIVDGKALCVYGGLPKNLQNLEEIKQIPRPLPNPKTNSLATALLFSEPREDYVSNREEDDTIFFGKKDVMKTLDRISMNVVFRGAIEGTNGGVAHFAGGTMVIVDSNLSNEKASAIYVNERKEWAIRTFWKEGNELLRIVTGDVVGDIDEDEEGDYSFVYDTDEYDTQGQEMNEGSVKN